MDTGTIAAISVGGVGLILLGMLIATLMRPRLYSAGPPVEKSTDYLSIINWFKVLYYFLPYSLFLFGIVYDGLVEKIKFFPAGFVGLLAVYLNSWFAIGGSTVDTDLCGVPGLSKWGSDISPQNIVFTSAVLGYIATYITMKRGTIEIMSTGAAWIGFTVVWVLQTIFYNVTGCSDKPWRTFGPVQIVPPTLAMVWGGGLGSLFGWVFSSFVDVGSGISADQQQALMGSSKSTPPAMGSTKDTPGAGKCSPTDSDDQFVCEAYKNGELVTSTIVE